MIVNGQIGHRERSEATLAGFSLPGSQTGQWGIYDLGHGYATGTPTGCDIDNPPAHCLFHDGFTVKRDTSPSPFYGAGGFFDGTSGANVGVVVDGDWANPIAGLKLGTG